MSMTSSTRLRARIVASFAVISSATILSAAVEPMGVTAVVGLLLVAVSIATLELGTWPGALAAIGASAATVQISRVFGAWDQAAYLPLVLIVGAFGLAAVTASGLRTSVARLHRHRQADPAMPANGSLGLLHESVAASRLDDELERAAFTGSPVTVVSLRTRLLEPDLPQPDRGRVLRVVSRTVESIMEVVHLPVAYSDAEILGILAETDAAAAERLVERIRRSCASATLLLGSDRGRRRFSDLATIDVGFAWHPEHGATASALIDHARASVRGTGDVREALVAVGPGLARTGPRAEASLALTAALEDDPALVAR